jgi:hypothetical protein
MTPSWDQLRAVEGQAILTVADHRRGIMKSDGAA